MAKLEPMMGTILAQLQTRRAEVDDVVDDLLRERDSIDAALAAGNGTPVPPAARQRARHRRPGPRPGAPRAPRGQNRERILTVTAEQARTVAEIAQLTGIKPTIVATTVSNLTRRGVLRREAGGYRSTPAPRRVRRGAVRRPRGDRR